MFLGPHVSKKKRGAALIMTNGEPVTVNVRNGARPEVLDAFDFLGQGYLFRADSDQPVSYPQALK